MRLASLLALILSAAVSGLRAQDPGIYVTFCDYADRSPIPFLRVCSDDTCAYTDENGRLYYRILSLEENVVLEIHSLGYRGKISGLVPGSSIYIHSYEVELSGVQINGFHLDRQNVETPGSTGQVAKRALGSMDKTSLQHAVNLIPGVTMESRGYGGSQRISIRGSFIRSPFAVRNVKMYLEGIPFSSPDGSSPLELFDSDDLQGIEILKGPGGSMYGSGTGGVMIFKPASIRQYNHLETEYMSGAYGLRRTHAALSLQLGKFSTRLSHVYQENDGYRQQEFNRKQQLTFTAQRDDLGKNDGRLFIYGTWFKGHLGLPGGLSAGQAEDDPMQANLYSATNNASLYRERAMTGISYRTRLGSSGVTSWTAAYFYYTDKQNPYGTSAFANGYKDEKALGYGLRSEWSRNITKGRVVWDADAGLEFQAEDFTITESVNAGGLPGDFKYNYDIGYLSSFMWLRSQWKAGDNLYIEAGTSANLDQNQVSGHNLDDFEYDTTLTGKLLWLPRAAISVQWMRDQWVHASFTAGNSQPTVFEQVDAVENAYNLDLRPERGENRELTLKGRLGDGGFQYEVSAYSFLLRDAIKAYEDSVYIDPPGGFESLTRYRNDGGTIQNGLECQILKTFSFTEGSWVNSVNVTSALNLTRYAFEDAGEERIPGIPRAAVTSALYVQSRQLRLSVFHYWYDRMALNDVNTAWSAAYHLINLRIEYGLIGGSPMSGYQWDFFAGINNVLDAEYTSFVQINAPGARYFNPAAGINVYGGIRIGLPLWNSRTR